MEARELVQDVRELKAKIRRYNRKADLKLIEKAVELARTAHMGQRRVDGEPYVLHPLGVASVLTTMKADTSTIIAGILHDVVEDTNVDLGLIIAQFGEEVASLVDGVTKTTGIRFESKEDYKAENLRKILFATTKDVRVMFIKLADRLHNMYTLKEFRPDKQVRIARETLEIYAPIAEKLGMWRMKGELEDQALRYINPKVYQFLKEKIAEKREVREQRAAEYVKKVRSLLKAHHVACNVSGRAKYFYSIYKKMQDENKSFDDIYDLIGIRVMVSSVNDCYNAMDIITKIWRPDLSRFKDFIKNPKSNGYRSLHGTFLEGTTKIEVQTRTRAMHLDAEEGIAAHWRYKGTSRDKKFDRRIAWLKQILEWKRESKDAHDFLENLVIDLFANEIVVFTPRGDPISLPEGSTPVDFAYEIHTNIGNRCSKAQVNGKIVPLNHPLRSGDLVKIITQKNAGPSRNWLKFAKTRLAKSKIRRFLNINIDPKSKPLQESIDKSLAELISTDLKMPIIISRCCNPEFGDDIAGMVTKDHKLKVHRNKCSNLKGLPETKLVKLSWKRPEENLRYTVVVTTKARIGALPKILNIVSQKKLVLRAINTRAIKDNINMMLVFSKSQVSKAQIDDLISVLDKNPDVTNIKQL